MSHAVHPDVVEAFDLIDAAVFSGDSFYSHEGRTLLREHLERWKKWDSETNYYAADGMLLNADGTRSIFDDVDQ